MPRAPTVRQADLERTLRALAAQGLTAARVEITPAGVIIIPGPTQPGAVGSGDPAGSTTGAQQGLTPPEPGVTSLDNWREGRARRASQGGGRADQGA